MNLKSKKTLIKVSVGYASILMMFFVGVYAYKRYLQMNGIDITFTILKWQKVIGDTIFALFGVTVAAVLVKGEELKNNKIAQFIFGILIVLLIKYIVCIIGWVRM